MHKPINQNMYKTYHFVFSTFLQRLMLTKNASPKSIDLSLAVTACMPPSEYIVSFVDKLYNDLMFVALLNKADKLSFLNQPVTMTIEAAVSQVIAQNQYKKPLEDV